MNLKERIERLLIWLDFDNLLDPDVLSDIKSELIEIYNLIEER